MRESMQACRLVFLSVCLSLLALSPACAQDAPNIVFIVVDDAGYADFGFMGSTEIPTPNLDALAATGVVFDQAHTGAACSPSRAAFLTGTGHNHWGYEANLQNTDDPLTEHFEGLPNSAVTMFERLKAEGYSTSVAGKWHVGGLDDVVENGVIVTPGNKPPKQGVDDFLGFQAGGGLQRMSLNPDGTNNVTNTSTSKYWSDLWGDTTVDYIDQRYQESNPFFVYASFNDPHSPIQEAPSFNDPRIAGLSGLRKRYASELLTVDDNVGKIVAKLEDPNGDGDQSDSIRDETMIVFLNDNGGVPGNSADNGILRGSKGMPYDGGTRVPMFISGAGIDPSAVGTRYGGLVHSIDIVPTMVAAAGGSIPAGEVEGVDLLPFINGADTSNPHELIAQRIQEEVQYRTNDWKLVKDGYAGEWELYDFSNINDQSEAPADDVAGSNPAMLQEMLRKLTDWEVTIDKQRFPSTDETISQFNLFDNFTHNGATTAFSTTNAWRGPSGATATMRDRDSHNGTVFHFATNDASSYTATNDLQRMNELEFIAHGFVFEGGFQGPAGRSATIDGLPVLLAKNAAGQAPTLNLSATGAGAQQFQFDLKLEARLYDDLVVDGNGDQGFLVSGDIVEYRQGRTITKQGSSTLRLAGSTAATGGGLVVNAGAVVVERTGSVAGNVTVANAAELMLSGTIDGSVVNSGRFSVDTNAPSGVQTVSLTPTLGDGDVDSRNSATNGDQDSELLVGSVSNATATQVERVQRALFSFDVGSLPSDAQVSEVSFVVEFNGNDSSSSFPFAGDLELRELLAHPAFSEVGSENVSWNLRDRAGNEPWLTPGGDLGALVAQVDGTQLPNPTTTSAGEQLAFDSTAAMLTAVQDALADGRLSLVALLPGEEAAAAAMTGDRSLYRFGSNESGASDPASLTITYSTGQATSAAINGDYTQDSSGMLAVELTAPDDFSGIPITGVANLDGVLSISLADGYTPSGADAFELLDANSIVGEFQNAGDGMRVGLADGGGSFLVSYDATNATISLSSFVPGPFLAGDYNEDGLVDAADFVVWRENVGAPAGTLPNDPHGSQVGADQYLAWESNYGNSLHSLWSPSQQSVPEPSASLILMATSACAHRRRATRQPQTYFRASPNRSSTQTELRRWIPAASLPAELGEPGTARRIFRPLAPAVGSDSTPPAASGSSHFEHPLRARQNFARSDN